LAKQLRFNWPLWVGLALLAGVAWVAIWGPSIAPADPLQENYIGQVGTRFIRPPFPPNAIEGFPLGSDEWGRDVLSRLLWAVRPTLILVLAVAGLRLLIGIALGLVAGWSNSRLARTVDTLISATLTIPVLFVALAFLALFGQQWGVWAFIAGLSLTGWAEAARIVREQTRAIRGQTFVEAARGLGAAPEQLILDHILPHVLPMMWIQLAFEVSSTLLAAAGLGFLGYFTNAVWIPVEDWVGLRAAGMPELGQMLGTGATNRQPWTTLYAGSCVAWIVLACNLAGEGLRWQMSPDRQRSRSDLNRSSARAGVWLQEGIYQLAGQLARGLRSTGVLVFLVLLVAGGTYLLWATQNTPEAAAVIDVPGGHWWATEKHDVQATSWSPIAGPRNPHILWTYQAKDSFVSGPLVNASGNLFFTGSSGTLYSVAADGSLRWSTALPAAPFGSPALTPDGRIMLADEEGYLSAYLDDGTLQWRVTFHNKLASIIAAPIVGANGMTYYATSISLMAVQPTGDILWKINLPSYSHTAWPLRLSPDGAYTFFEDIVVNANTGRVLFGSTAAPMDKYMIGSNGKIYLRHMTGADEWQPTDAGAVLIKIAALDTRVLSLSFRQFTDAGVSPSGSFWFLFSSGSDVPRFVWTDPDGQNPQIKDLGNSTGRMIGLDQTGRVYACSQVKGDNWECWAFLGATTQVEWRLELPDAVFVTGGAIAPGRLYLISGAGSLYALGD
jgi:peptide/nickel transport system permease protein